MKFSENTSRSVLKAITHRMLILIFSAIITFALLPDNGKALTIVLLTNAANMILYFVHERLWDSVNWGRAGKK